MIPLILYFDSSLTGATGGGTLAGTAESIGGGAVGCSAAGETDCAAGTEQLMRQRGDSLLDWCNTAVALLTRKTIAMIATMATHPISAGRRMLFAFSGSAAGEAGLWEATAFAA